MEMVDTARQGAHEAPAEPQAPPSRAEDAAVRRPILSAADAAFQDRMLLGVSRTFALTIPELPAALREVVGNGYLLCRIADTIEDDPALSHEDRRGYHEAFCAAVEGGDGGAELASRLAPRLSSETSDAERELVRELPRVLSITHAFSDRQRAALARCVRIMCSGMDCFQSGSERDGLDDVSELHSYCYYVAGVVGEMLTELFCDYSSEIDAQRDGLFARTVSFGQGLQMTNILKDVWDDWERGFCWLPRDVFQRHGLDIGRLEEAAPSAGFASGLEELIGIAHGHLRNALEYTLLIPPGERGIRRFCLWSLGMAVLTLRKIHRRIDYRASRDVKIKRSSVKATVFTSNVLSGSDRLLRLTFSLCSAGLPGPRFVG